MIRSWYTSVFASTNIHHIDHCWSAGALIRDKERGGHGLGLSAQTHTHAHTHTKEREKEKRKKRKGRYVPSIFIARICHCTSDHDVIVKLYMLLYNDQRAAQRSWMSTVFPHMVFILICWLVEGARWEVSKLGWISKRGEGISMGHPYVEESMIQTMHWLFRQYWRWQIYSSYSCNWHWKLVYIKCITANWKGKTFKTWPCDLQRSSSIWNGVKNMTEFSAFLERQKMVW